MHSSSYIKCTVEIAKITRVQEKWLRSDKGIVAQVHCGQCETRAKITEVVQMEEQWSEANILISRRKCIVEMPKPVLMEEN